MQVCIAIFRCLTKVVLAPNSHNTILYISHKLASHSRQQVCVCLCLCSVDRPVSPPPHSQLPTLRVTVDFDSSGFAAADGLRSTNKSIKSKKQTLCTPHLWGYSSSSSRLCPHLSVAELAAVCQLTRSLMAQNTGICPHGPDTLNAALNRDWAFCIASFCSPAGCL